VLSNVYEQVVYILKMARLWAALTCGTIKKEIKREKKKERNNE